MKTITINVDEAVHRSYAEYAKRSGQPTSAVIRAAMEEYYRRNLAQTSTLRSRRPARVGGPVRPVTSEDDLLGKMLGDPRD